MKSGLLKLINTFVRVVEVGSFSAVAEETRSTQPTISRQINTLEDHLGVRLLHRTTRTLELTEEGQSYYTHAVEILASVDRASEAVSAGSSRVAGTLRIAGSVAFTRIQVVPRIKRFLDQWPEVNTDFILDERPIDLLEENIDIGIRIGQVTDDTLKCVQVGEMRRFAMASPEYIEKRGRPNHPEDLKDHDCVIYTQLAKQGEWEFFDAETHKVIRVKVAGRFRATASEAMGVALIEGNGIGLGPIWAFAEFIEQGRLIPLLENYEPPALPINLVYPARRVLAPRTRAFIEFITEEFRDDRWLTLQTEKSI